MKRGGGAATSARSPTRSSLETDDGAEIPGGVQGSKMAGGAAGAALLRRLRHPSIVELEAIFQSDGRFYLQLPWYANGTLDEWFKATRPSPLALAAVLLQLCRAMSQVSCCRPGSYQS